MTMIVRAKSSWVPYLPPIQGPKQSVEISTTSLDARPLYELIYEVLRSHLLGHKFPDGLVFGEAVVARAFGSSRIPAAMALEKLRSDGLLENLKGRGSVAAGSKLDKLVRAELIEVGLNLPAVVIGNLEVRNHHGRIYPQVEHTVAASLSFGRFLVNESALADHYEVSRTVAHEVLTRLERTGLISQAGNQRWYAGPLTTDKLRDHFEMRWLLEPQALSQSMDSLDNGVVEERRAHVERALKLNFTPLRLEKLETELHVATVLSNCNEQMAFAIRRNQMPVIATHSAFASYPHVEELGRTLVEHLEVYDFILKRNKRAAMLALENHVKRALEPNLERLKNIGTLPESLRPPFLMRVEADGQVRFRPA
jgi:DNA-binding GntR family transcriptional regulator